MTSEKIFWQVFPLSLVPSYFVRGGKEKFLFLFSYSCIYLFIYLCILIVSLFIFIATMAANEKILTPQPGREKSHSGRRELFPYELALLLLKVL